ncbi:MAG: NAD(P)-binding protein [Sporosarcina sp.]
MDGYPIMLNLKNKEAVVVGGGQIAYRKIAGLLQSGACVTVISPVIQLKIEELLSDNRIAWRNKIFEPEDLDSAWIVIAATNNEKVNEFVALSAGNYQLVNVVDNQEISTFHVPAKLTRGDLTISVATGGASPTLAKVIRDELAAIYDESYEEYLEFLALARVKVKHSILNQKIKTKLLKEITNVSYRQSNEKQQAFLETIKGFAITEDDPALR